MKSKWYSIILAALIMAFAAPAVHAALTGPVGTAIDPHGFPAFYGDGAVQLEPCLPPPAGNAALRADMCAFDPLAGGALQVGSELFFWMADAELPPLVPGGKARLVLALEGAFTAEVPIDGQQMTFARLRIRVDVPTVGTYTITHPYGLEVFEVTNILDGINMTRDIGDINILAPDNAFVGALNGDIGPFLTWPGYQNDNTLKAFGDNGAVAEQYIGNPNIPHVVTGGTNGNAFRIQGPGGIDLQTDLFSVMGKVFTGVLGTAHVFPPPPTPKLFAVGPVNREGAVGIPTVLQPEGIRTGVNYPNFPVGFPLWYQDNAATSTPTAPVGGIKLGYCPGTDPMCISEPVDPTNANSVALRAGGEGFWWSADALIDGANFGNAFEDARLVLAVEAFFNNDIIFDGNQIGFARRRIRVAGLPQGGEYTITHPYGTEVLTAVSDGKGAFEINDTIDDMILNTNLANIPATDNAFTGALFGRIGPQFLKWTTFNADPALNDPTLQRPLVPGDFSRMVMYVGNPGVFHAVTGSPTGNNIFRVQGGGIDAQTTLFSVSGMVFDPAFIAAGTVLPGLPAPVAEVITVAKARLRQRSLQLDLSGTSNALGSTLVIHAGPDASGPVLGQVLVTADGWRLRTVATTNLTSVTVVSSTGATLANQPVQVR